MKLQYNNKTKGLMRDWQLYADQKESCINTVWDMGKKWDV